MLLLFAFDLFLFGWRQSLPRDRRILTEKILFSYVFFEILIAVCGGLVPYVLLHFAFAGFLLMVGIFPDVLGIFLW
jgi:hypothetical protein